MARGAADGHGADDAVCLDKVATALLVSVNMILAGYAGAALVTAARLQYDPTTYVVARLVFPDDVDLTSAKLPQAALAVLVLAHVAAGALVLPARLRITLLALYALGTLCMVIGEVWLAQRVWAGVHRQLLQTTARLEETLGHVRVALGIAAQLTGYAYYLSSILADVQKDAPVNLRLAWRAFYFFITLQVCGVLLAAVAAVTGLRRARAARATRRR